MPPDPRSALCGCLHCAQMQVLGKTFYLDKANFADADLLARLSPGSSESSESSTSIQADD